MRRTGYVSILAVVGALHVFAFSLILRPFYWKYLLLSGVSAAVLWGLLPMILPFSRWWALFTAGLLAFAVHQTGFYLWRSKLDGLAWALAQFASIQIVVALVLRRWIRPSNGTGLQK